MPVFNQTFTLRNVHVDQVSTRDQLKHVIRTQLTDDIIIGGDFDVGYYQASTVVSIRTPQDVKEIWNDVKQGVKHVLWCDGLKPRSALAYMSYQCSPVFIFSPHRNTVEQFAIKYTKLWFPKHI